MKLWKISQNVNQNFETFDCAVVAAETLEEAQKIHPGTGTWYGSEEEPWWLNSVNRNRTWATKLEEVQVEYIGETSSFAAGAVICSSYNAG